jgi:CelD/BcsL family acetyltransferase involved in cellulose biosynthesis
LTAPDGVCPVVPLAGHTWDSYLASLGSSHRANVRRRLKQLAANFDMRFERVTADADRLAALDALAAWHGPRFADRGGSTAFTTPELRAFHDEATRRMLERGWLRMYVLRLDGAIAAVMYGFLYDRQFYFYQHGFDDRHRQHSVGLVLMALCIRAAIDERAHTFDMLWGTESYKSLWARDRRLLHRIHLFPPHPGGRLHRCAIEARRQLGRLARTVLPGKEGPLGT